jgi:hypothetical protein
MSYLTVLVPVAFFSATAFLFYGMIVYNIPIRSDSGQ